MTTQSHPARPALAELGGAMSKPDTMKPAPDLAELRATCLAVQATNDDPALLATRRSDVSLSPSTVLALLDRCEAQDSELRRLRMIPHHGGCEEDRLTEVMARADAERERDAALARVEAAERERDEAREVAKNLIVTSVADDITAEHIAALRLEVHEHDIALDLATAERDAALAEAERLRGEVVKMTDAWRLSERDTAERIALEAEDTAKSYDANAFDSSDWYVKAARLLRDFAADIRANAWKESKR